MYLLLKNNVDFIKNMLTISINMALVSLCFILYQNLSSMHNYYEKKLSVLEIEKNLLKDSLLIQQQKTNLAFEYLQKENGYLHSDNVNIIVMICILAAMIIAGNSMHSASIDIKAKNLSKLIKDSYLNHERMAEIYARNAEMNSTLLMEKFSSLETKINCLLPDIVEPIVSAVDRISS